MIPVRSSRFVLLKFLTTFFDLFSSVPPRELLHDFKLIATLTGVSYQN